MSLPKPYESRYDAPMTGIGDSFEDPRSKTSRSVAALIVVLTLSQGERVLARRASSTTCDDPPVVAKVIAEPAFDMSGWHRFLFGSDYRDLWATPIEVEVLDLACEAGGLEPIEQVGQLQTPGLAMRGADGRSFTFRSVTKDPTRVLPESLQDTPIADIVWDQVSSTLPGASVSAAPVVEAADVLQTQPRLVVMPDDPSLGEHRETFAGLLGTFEEFPSVGSFGTTAIESSEEVFARITESFDEQIDDRAFLKARLVDLLIGDFDRHVKQWRWAKTAEDRYWQPLPEDRDYAFSRYDGLAMRIWRDREPRFDVFGAKYPSLEGLTWSARSLDRRLVSGLDRTVWREVALELQSALTDEVLEDALHRRTPPEYLDLVGEDLLQSLQARRDSLLAEAEKFYEFLAKEVNVYGTNQADEVLVDRSQDGSITIQIAEPRPGNGQSCDHQPGGLASLFHRRFLSGETRDIRLYTGAGEDRVVVRGPPSDSIKVRIIGGAGPNRLCDELTGEETGFDLSNADQPGRGKKISKGLWLPPGEPLEENGIPEYGGQQGPALTARRDWGRTSYGEPWLGYGEDLGFFVGYGRIFETFSFRKRPYATQHRIRGGFAFGVNRPRVDYRGYFRTENRRRYWKLRAEASGFDLLNFYGFGNETEAVGDSDFYNILNGRVWTEASLILSVAERSKASVGPVIRFTTTDTGRDDFISSDQPYGVEDIGQAGLRGRFQFNSRRAPDERDLKFTDDVYRFGPSTMGSGLLAELDAYIYPEVGDLESAYSLARAILTGDYKLFKGGTFVGFRVGGQKNWGTYPYYDAAFLGAEQVRGLARNRFAGDASLFGDLALRQRVARLQVLVPGYLGITARVDTGRVFLKGEDSNRWHSSYGGGLWWAPWSGETRFELYVATSEEETRAYLLMGFRH